MGIRYTQREMALKIAWHYLGTIYTWGGDDPTGFDCSGLVIECLKSGGTLPRGKGDWTAASLFEEFKKGQVNYLRAGNLAFYKNEGDGRIVHVEMCVDDKRTIGANGGGSHVRNIDDARKYNAFVQVRPVDRTRPFVIVDPYPQHELDIL